MADLPPAAPAVPPGGALSPPGAAALPIVHVGRLADSALQASIDNALASIPAGDSGSLTAGFTLRNGGNLTIILAERLGENWSVKAGFSVDIGGHPEGEVVLQGSW